MDWYKATTATVRPDCAINEDPLTRAGGNAEIYFLLADDLNDWKKLRDLGIFPLMGYSRLHQIRCSK